MRVGLFVTCINDAMFPGVGRATVALLERLGVTVEFPAAQTCCGQMHVNSGYRGAGESLAARFSEVFRGYDAVVTPSASCAAMVRHHYPQLLPATTPPPVYEVSEFLVDVLGVIDVGAAFPYAVALHQTCHSQRLLGIGDRPRRLLAAVAGLRLVELTHPTECCGFGGTFSVKNRDTSVAMGRDKVADVIGTGAQVLASADVSCLLHIGGLMSREDRPVRVMHLVEILAGDAGRDGGGARA
jgi:L-lactate dehydrogenase complex protein LldE